MVLGSRFKVIGGSCATGFKPFVEACIEEGATTEAAKYIAKTTDPEERAKVGGPRAGREEKISSSTHTTLSVSTRVFHIGGSRGRHCHRIVS